VTATSGARFRWLRGFLVALGLFLLSAAMLLVPRATHSFAQGATPAQAGRVLYEERCATCHGEQGGGTGIGPPIAGLGPAWYDFMLSTGRMPVDRPAAQATRKRPAFDRADIDELIAYLVALPPGAGTPVPRVDPQLGDVARGQQVFELNCAACHSTSGNGGAVGPEVAPSLHVATPTQIGEAVRIGPGTMPVFDQQAIDSDDLNSLTRYVLYLRDPNDRGGAGLNHAGPIIEGFVAIVIGLGALVLVTRFIGARA
jgi:ubiquinol-cytochrome c reductase cytochrome c subunit